MTSPATVGAASEPHTESTSLSDRALAVLDYVTQTESPPGLMEIAVALNLPKATASRLCAHLQARQWLMRHERDRGFSPGPKLLQLAARALQADPRHDLRHALLLALVQDVGETVNLTMLDGSRVRYLDRVETHWPLRMQLDVGSHVPIHATASGKLFLAQMPAVKRAVILNNVLLTACTPHTLTTAEALQAECQRIAHDGYACDHEEFMLGMIAVAVPVRDIKGDCRAALAIHAPTVRMSLAQAKAQLPRLHETAQRMAGVLF